MLKIVLASLGITIDQATVDEIMRDGITAIQAVKDMKASQDRCEAMLMAMRPKAQLTDDQFAKLCDDLNVQPSTASQHKTIDQVQS